MIKVIYVFLLMAASVEDYRHHQVKKIYVYLSVLIGCIRMCTVQEHRWVSLTLTCSFFLVLYLLYRLAVRWAARTGRAGGLGGADVRLIPGMMLVQGWDVALTGIFLGLLTAVLVNAIRRRWKEEIPLVPWMAAGCILVELLRGIGRIRIYL